MKAELHAACAHVIGSLLNGVYQGVLLWLLMGALAWCWGRTNAATRHALWFATLLLVALLIPAHCWLDHRRPDQPLAAEPEKPAIASAGVVEPLVLAEPDPAPEFGAPAASDSFGVEQPDAHLTEPVAPVSGSEIANVAAPCAVPSLAGPDQAKRGLAPGSLRWLAARCLSPISWNADSPAAFGIVTSLSLLWCLITAVRLVVVARRLCQLRGLVRRASPAVAPAAAALFQSLVMQLGIRRPVELRLTSERQSAVFVGFRRPAILLPLEAINDLDEAGHVLRHELAHVQRYDDWTNLIQHLVQACLFFHPAVLWINRRLALEREIACDDHVLQSSCGRRQYALILANLAARVQKRTALLAPGISHDRSQLQHRINMILNTRRNSSPKLAKARLTSTVSLAAVTAILVAYSAPRLVLAASADSAPPTIRSGTATVIAPTPTPSARVATDSADLTTPPVALAGEPGPTSAADAGIDPGPKFKADAAEPAEPAEAAPGAPPEPPVLDVVPRPPRAPRAAKPGRNSAAAGFPDDSDNASIEERVKRLEKMVRSLVEQQNGKHAHGALSFKDGPNQNWNEQEQMDKMKEMAERESERAAEQAQRAVEQANRARKDLARRNDAANNKGEVREALQKQLEALRQAREGLGREMDRLDRQIQKLQQEQERSDQDAPRRRSAANVDRLHADVSVNPDIAVTTEQTK